MIDPNGDALKIETLTDVMESLKKYGQHIDFPKIILTGDGKRIYIAGVMSDQAMRRTALIEPETVILDHRHEIDEELYMCGWSEIYQSVICSKVITV